MIATKFGFKGGKASGPTKRWLICSDKCHQKARNAGTSCARVAAGQKPWILPIPGTTKLHRLEENIAAAALQLTKEDLTSIESALAQVRVQGERYPEHLQRQVGRSRAERPIVNGPAFPKVPNAPKRALLMLPAAVKWGLREQPFNRRQR